MESYKNPFMVSDKAEIWLRRRAEFCKDEYPRDCDNMTRM